MTEADRVFLIDVRRGLLAVASAIDKRLKAEQGSLHVPLPVSKGLRDVIQASMTEIHHLHKRYDVKESE